MPLCFSPGAPSVTAEPPSPGCCAGDPMTFILTQTESWFGPIGTNSKFLRDVQCYIFIYLESRIFHFLVLFWPPLTYKIKRTCNRVPVHRAKSFPVEEPPWMTALITDTALRVLVFHFLFPSCHPCPCLARVHTQSPPRRHRLHSLYLGFGDYILLLSEFNLDM